MEEVSFFGGGEETMPSYMLQGDKGKEEEDDEDGDDRTRLNDPMEEEDEDLPPLSNFGDRLEALAGEDIPLACLELEPDTTYFFALAKHNLTRAMGTLMLWLDDWVFAKAENELTGEDIAQILPEMKSRYSFEMAPGCEPRRSEDKTRRLQQLDALCDSDHGFSMYYFVAYERENRTITCHMRWPRDQQPNLRLYFLYCVYKYGRGPDAEHAFMDNDEAFAEKIDDADPTVKWEGVNIGLELDSARDIIMLQVEKELAPLRDAEN